MMHNCPNQEQLDKLKSFHVDKWLTKENIKDFEPHFQDFEAMA